MEKFFDSVLCKTDTPEKMVASYLSARGFFIDINSDKSISVSDNNTKGDKSDIEKILAGFKIGYVEDDFSIIITNVENINKLKELFTCNTYISYEVTTWYHDWLYFRNKIFGTNISTLELEPFVARYVKTLSSCGLDTSLSCDGYNHNKRILIEFNGHCYDVWHKLLWELCLSNRFSVKWDKQYNKIPFTCVNQEDIYIELNKVADFLYRNRLLFRDMKHQTTRFINRNNKKDDSYVCRILKTNAKKYLSEMGDKLE